MITIRSIDATATSLGPLNISTCISHGLGIASNRRIATEVAGQELLRMRRLYPYLQASFFFAVKSLVVALSL